MTTNQITLDSGGQKLKEQKPVTQWIRNREEIKKIKKKRKKKWAGFNKANNDQQLGIDGFAIFFFFFLLFKPKSDTRMAGTSSRIIS